MWKLPKQIAIEGEQGFALPTNDFFRPDLKQIGNSIFEIKRHFIAEGGRTVTPSSLEESLSEVKDRLLGLVENDAFFSGLNPKIDNEIKYNNYPKTEPCFMFLSEILSFALDFETGLRPNTIICDVFIAFPSMPTMVLSIVDGDEESEEALVYNTSVARGVRERLIRFMDEDVNSIHGVINTSTLKDSVAFNARLKDLATDSFHFVSHNSLSMNSRRYDRVLTAFWAGVAETKSVLRETCEADNDCLRFLTKEQCIILVENINSKDVEVKCVPGSGATTLMLEVARRLNRLGDTLLVCRSQQESDILRSVCPSAVSVNDLSGLDLSSYVNIVDETNSVPLETRCRRWQFTRYLTDIKQLKCTKWMLEREIDRMEKLLDVFAKDTWRRRMGYLLGDFDVLILLFEKIKRKVVFNQTENSPHGGSFSFETLPTIVYETALSSWQERVEQKKNVFPLLRSVMVKDRTSLIYQDVKMAFLEKGQKKQNTTSASPDTPCEAKDEGKQKNTTKTSLDTPCAAKDGVSQKNTTSASLDTSSEAKDEGNQKNTTSASPETSSEAKDEGKQKNTTSASPETSSEAKDEGKQTNRNDQATDGLDAEGRIQDVEALNEDLDSLTLNRNHRRRQLDGLQTDCWTLVEWQNSVDYLMRYPEVLSLFNVELPGMDSESNSHREHQDESNLPSRFTPGQGKVFTRDLTQKLPGVTSKLVEMNTEDVHSAEDGCHSTSRYTGLIHQLRKHQHGTLKDRDLTALTLKLISVDEQKLASLTARNDSLEKGFGSTVHIVGLESRPLPISCPKLHLDAARANTRWCHVTPDGELVNRRPDTQDEGKDRLQRYKGTCSSPIPLPPHFSTLTPQPTTPRYWETETRVRVVGEWPVIVLEMGVCEAGQVDIQVLMPRQRSSSCCVRIGTCGSHGDSLCTWVCREVGLSECHHRLPRTPDTQATLHYGIVLDVGRGRVAFTDIDRQVVLDKFNVEFREPLVPTFSAGWGYPDLTASMRLISGEDIDMTDTKKVLIYQALN